MLLAAGSAMASDPARLDSKTGNHAGEEINLRYAVEYLDPLGVTIADADGITYAPFSYAPSYESKVYPTQYFGSYPLYFSGMTLHFRVHITNTDRRMFRNLQLLAWQEWLHESGGSGEAFAEPNLNEWFVDALQPGQTIVLEGTSAIPFGPSGLDQTHLQIIHRNGDDSLQINGGGEIIVDDPQAGIWCPAGSPL
ncbi:MAG: hypothetical protein Q8Q39_00140 [bacterium]|nr:hypothetical protein [bacterium]